jgi:hypothetical protein
MIKFNAYISDQHENSPAPGRTNRRLRIALTPTEAGQSNGVVDSVSGGMAFELTQPLEAVFKEFSVGQKITITLNSAE